MMLILKDQQDTKTPHFIIVVLFKHLKMKITSQHRRLILSGDTVFVTEQSLVRDHLTARVTDRVTIRHPVTGRVITRPVTVTDQVTTRSVTVVTDRVTTRLVSGRVITRGAKDQVIMMIMAPWKIYLILMVMGILSHQCQIGEPIVLKMGIEWGPPIQVIVWLQVNKWLVFFLRCG